MAVLVEPLEMPVRMMRRSSKVKWEKESGFFIGVPTFPAAERQDKCKTKSNRNGSRNESRTKFHFSLLKVEINFSLHSLFFYTDFTGGRMHSFSHAGKIKRIGEGFPQKKDCFPEAAKDSPAQNRENVTCRKYL